jgi:hypothetical protein
MRWFVLTCLFPAVMAASAAGWERELKWDSGVWRSIEGCPEGRGSWFGNDFEIAPAAGPD